MNILKKILLLFLLICSLNAKDLAPSAKIEASGGVTDMVISNNKLYVATKAGKVDIFDVKTKKYLTSITLPLIIDFVGDEVESKIYSIDVLKNRVLIVSQGQKGGRNLSLFTDDKLTNIISDKKRMYIANAKFISDKEILFSTLSNQLYLYDLISGKNTYDKQVSQSKFSHFVLNEDKSEVIIADESGDLKIINVQNSHLRTTLKGQNLDNVFQVAWKNGTIITAGQDRRTVVYNNKNYQPYIRESSFLIYGCALSNSGKIAAYSSDEQNNVTIFNTQSKENLFKLIDNKMTISKILFLNEHEVFIGTDDKVINFYKLL